MKPSGFSVGRPTASAVVLRISLILGVALTAIASARF
jgi:hypothetical protein